MLDYGSLQDFLRGSSKKAGLPPGSIVHTGRVSEGPARVHVTRFAGPEYERFADVDPEETQTVAGRTTWVEVIGVHDADILKSLGTTHRLHPLLLEDVAHTTQRPKIEESSDGVFATLRLIESDGEESLLTQQISLFFREGLVICFVEQECNALAVVRNRLANHQGRVRDEASDYLAYCVMDSMVDSNFVVLEELGEEVEDLEESVLNESGRSESIGRLQHLRAKVMVLRRVLVPLKEVSRAFLRLEAPAINESNRPFLQDLYDHALNLRDTIDGYREILTEMLELRMANESMRMNNTMKTLTTMASIFIPLTFLAGIYGMNFKYMPELEWRYGYPAAVALMSGVGLGLFAYFRLRRWL